LIKRNAFKFPVIFLKMRADQIALNAEGSYTLIAQVIVNGGRVSKSSSLKGAYLQGLN
jgi:hypothetical protein